MLSIHLASVSAAGLHARERAGTLEHATGAGEARVCRTGSLGGSTSSGRPSCPMHQPAPTSSLIRRRVPAVTTTGRAAGALRGAIPPVVIAVAAATAAVIAPIVMPVGKQLQNAYHENSGASKNTVLDRTETSGTLAARLSSNRRFASQSLQRTPVVAPVVVARAVVAAIVVAVPPATVAAPVAAPVAVPATTATTATTARAVGVAAGALARKVANLHHKEDGQCRGVSSQEGVHPRLVCRVPAFPTSDTPCPQTVRQEMAQLTSPQA